MAVYNPTTEDLECGLGMRPQLMVVRETAKGGWKWKLCVLLSLVAFCAAAAALLFFTWHVKNQGQLPVEQPAERHVGQPEDSGHHHMLQQLAGKSKSAIHLEGDWDPELNTSIEWRDSIGHSFSQGDLSLKDNQIIISTAGLYFVYSQASFQIKCDPNSNAGNQRHTHLFHNVWRFSNSYDGNKPLLGTIKTSCTGAKQGLDSSGHVFSTIYLGAVFQLEKGDRLWTETNHLKDIEVNGGKTFFGVFAL